MLVSPGKWEETGVYQKREEDCPCGKGDLALLRGVKGVRTRSQRRKENFSRGRAMTLKKEKHHGLLMEEASLIRGGFFEEKWNKKENPVIGEGQFLTWGNVLLAQGLVP